MPTLNWIGKEAVVNHHQHVGSWADNTQCLRQEIRL
jgi:hypothetical protein